LRGIVRVPRIDDNGDIHSLQGYDPNTGLFHDRVPALTITPAPTLDDARKMAETLWLPFSKYQFDDPGAGKALVLAAIFTALERPFLPVAPMFVVRSSMPATGKGKLARALAHLAFDTAPVVLTWGGNSEEFEKRLTAILLQAPAALMIDNANGMQIQGDLLESVITEGRAGIRPLGCTEFVKVKNRSLMTLTGNNPIITGDMARRAIPLDIVPRSADPERDRYNFDPVKVTRRDRIALLHAAFTIMRAFRLQGMPPQALPAVGSFDEWATRVRDLVYWLTSYDVSVVFRQNKAEDPRRQTDAALLAALHQHFGAASFKAADVIAVHKKVEDARRSQGTVQPTSAEKALHDALDDALPSKGVNPKLFGFRARRLKGAHNGGFILEIEHDPATNSNLITVRPTAAVAIVPGSPGSPGSFQP
jgi:putative DNA primase/helicase